METHPSSDSRQAARSRREILRRISQAQPAQAERSPTPPGRRLTPLLLGALIAGGLAVSPGSEWRLRARPPVEDDPLDPALITATARALPVPATAERSDGSRGSSTVVLEATGYVVARKRASLSPGVSGRLESVSVEVGDRVAAGAVLATLDERQARIDQSIADLALAERALGVEASRLSMRLAEGRFRTDQALRDRSALAERKYQEAKTEYEAARVAMRRAEVAREQAEQELASARLRRESHVLRAPFTGVVSRVNARPGEAVAPVASSGGLIPPGIVELVDPHSLEIVANVPERQFGLVALGRAVEVEIKTDAAAVFDSSVAWIVPVSDRQSGTVEVGISAPASHSEMIDGMEVAIRFLSQPHESPKASEETEAYEYSALTVR